MIILPIDDNNVSFDVFVAGTMKNAVFWDITEDRGECFSETSDLTRSTWRHIP
jgi:hypothetical protein